MNHNHLKTAISEAERFLDRAKKAERAFEFREFNDGSGGYWTGNGVMNGACVRASMDLTRALADLRRAD